MAKPKKSVSIQPYVQTQEFGYYTAPENLRVGALGINVLHNNFGSGVAAIPEENYRSYLARGEVKFSNQLKASKAELATGVNVPPMTARRYGNTKRSRNRKLLRSFVASGPNPQPNNFETQFNYKLYLKDYPRAKEEWNQLVAENEAAATMAGTNLVAELATQNGSARRRKRKTRKSHRK
jgi:hypothetical protein